MAADLPPTADLAPLKIGGLTIPVPVALAPMAGYTDSAFRHLCRRQGCGLVFTEVTNARGVVHGSARTLHLLECGPAERPAAAHLYGSEPDVVARAAAGAEALGRFDLIDINCGCPVRRIMARGAGAALMDDPGRVEAIVRAVKQAVSLPVTVKTRLGLSPGSEAVFQVARAVENGGGDALAVHARFVASRHSGEADWEALGRVKAACRIPVIGNGGIRGAEDALAMLRRTGVDGVMVGRAAIGNPWVFAEILARLTGAAWAPPSAAERRAVIAGHLEGLLALKRLERRRRRRDSHTPEQAAALTFRAHLVRYLAGLPGGRDFRRALSGMDSLESVMAAVDGVLG
jgi:nifR3 family TIM-barrel protein